MREFKQIVCPVDFSEFSAHALFCASSLAEKYDAGLSVLHVVELWRQPLVFYSPSPALAEYREQVLEVAAAKLLEFVRAHHAEPSKIHRVVLDGAAPDAILDVARQRAADLVVMGTHGRRGFDRLMVGSVAERVIRNAAIPVLAVRVAPQGGRVLQGPAGPACVRQVLCCTDFSENSMAALECARSLAQKFSAGLTLLHVVERTGGVASQAEAEAGRRLEQLLPPTGLEAGEVRYEVRTGKPYKQIIQVASEIRADVVVMAVRGPGAMDVSR